MAFIQEPTKTPESIGNIVVFLRDGFDNQGTPFQGAKFDVAVMMSDGSEVRRRGDLAPHITPAQRQALMDFMMALRAQAEDEILP